MGGMGASCEPALYLTTPFLLLLSWTFLMVPILQKK